MLSIIGVNNNPISAKCKYLSNSTSRNLHRSLPTGQQQQQRQQGVKIALTFTGSSAASLRRFIYASNICQYNLLPLLTTVYISVLLFGISFYGRRKPTSTVVFMIIHEEGAKCSDFLVCSNQPPTITYNGSEIPSPKSCGGKRVVNIDF